MEKLTASNLEELPAQNQNELIDAVYSAAPPEGFTLNPMYEGIRAVVSGGNVSCNRSIADFFDTSDLTQTIYVDSAAADNTADGLTFATPLKSLHAAIDLVNSSAIPSMVMIKAGYYGIGDTFTNEAAKTITTKCAFAAYGGRVVTGHFYTDTVFVKEPSATNVWYADNTGGATTEPLDMTRLSSTGTPITPTKVADIATCDDTPNSWARPSPYSRTYVNFGRTPNAQDALIGRRVERAYFGATADVLFRGVDFIGGMRIAKTSAGAVSVLHDDCRALLSSKPQAGGGYEPADGFEITGNINHIAFNSDASCGSKDGFNYHASGIYKPSPLLVNCSGYINGIMMGTSTSCNGVTTHGAVAAIDFGGTWLGSRGSNSAHVSDGTEYWGVGVTAGDSIGDIENGGTGNFGAFGAWLGAAKVWLDSCRDVGAPIGIYAADNADVMIRNHKGSGLRVAENGGTIEEY